MKSTAAKTKAKTKLKSEKSVLGKRKLAASRSILAFERVATGISGLDAVLKGGFLRGGTYLILGAPGTGKTILANQICFHQIKQGHRAVYVTLLAESHTRMFGNLHHLSFFEESKVSNEIQYMSGYSALEKEGLDGLLRLLRELVDVHDAKVLFIDGVASADALSGSTEQFKKFVHHLNSVLGIAGCTTFLLSSAEGEQSRPEYTMVDGIVNLAFAKSSMHTLRQLEVRKFRGSPHLYGQHFLEITDDGIQVYPRTETVYGLQSEPRESGADRVTFELPQLDQMLNGGLPGGSVTALLGAAGTGKTQIGMQFLRAGAKRGEPSLLLGFYEDLASLERRLSRMGASVNGFVRKGLLAVMRPEQSTPLVDKVVGQLVSEIKARGIKRLFIDGVNGLCTHTLEKERLIDVMTPLTRELRALGVTTLYTEETDSFRSQSGGILSNESAVTDNIFEFRYAELDGIRCQTLNVLKSRETDHDPSIRLIEFTGTGIRVGTHLVYTTSYLPVVKRKLT